MQRSHPFASFRSLVLCTSILGGLAALGRAQTLTPMSDITPGGAGVISFTVTAPTLAGGIGFLMFAPERSAPLPTPFGTLWLSAPVVLGAVVLSPSGTFSYPLPPATPPFAAAFQAIIVDPTLTTISLTNYAMAGFSPVGLLAAGEGVAAHYDDRTKGYRVDVVGQPGAVVEVNIVEPRTNHVINIARGQIGPNGELVLQGVILPGGLGAGNHLEVKVNGVKKAEFR